MSGLTVKKQKCKAEKVKWRVNESDSDNESRISINLIFGHSHKKHRYFPIIDHNCERTRCMEIHQTDEQVNAHPFNRKHYG